MTLKQFQIISKLGEGAYSTVYKVRRLQDNNIYALKRVKLPILSNKEKDNALNEVRLLASVRHPNIICYKQAFIDEATKSLCIVMQFANNGDLHQKICENQRKNQYFKESDIWNVFIQLVKGLRELHNLQIFHRDIKSANVFLTNQSNVKLGDLNVSKVSEKGLCMTQTGTPYYASPQVWKDCPYDEKSDIWSLGCVLYEMVTLKPPFKGEDMQVLYKKIVRGIYPRIPSEFSQDLSNLIRGLLQTNPSSRPTCQKILQMPIIVKRLQNRNLENLEKPQLLRTIRAQNIFSLLDQLPKPNYLPLRVSKEKGIQGLIETLQEKQRPFEGSQIESLPLLERERKIKPNENSDRLVLKHKQSLIVIERDRKQSQMSVSKGLQVNGVNCKGLKELKLPKVVNRYNQQKRQKIKKQKSVRAHRDISNY